MDREQRDLKKLLQFLLALDVTVVFKSGIEWQRLLMKPSRLKLAPFSGDVGICWEDRTICAYDSTPWPSILHEAGHLVGTDQVPDLCDESLFLGWEWAVVKYLKLSEDEFLSSNQEYVIDWHDPSIPDGSKRKSYFLEIGELLEGRYWRSTVKRCMDWHVVRAQEHGSVDANRVPVGHPERVRNADTVS